MEKRVHTGGRGARSTPRYGRGPVSVPSGHARKVTPIGLPHALQVSDIPTASLKDLVQPVSAVKMTVVAHKLAIPMVPAAAAAGDAGAVRKTERSIARSAKSLHRSPAKSKVVKVQEDPITQTSDRVVARSAKAIHRSTVKQRQATAQEPSLPAAYVEVPVVSAPRPQRQGRVIDIVMTNAVTEQQQACACQNCQNNLPHDAVVEYSNAAQGRYDPSWRRYFSWLTES